jgi:ribosome-associated protein
MQTFPISGEYIELNKLLKASGLFPTGGTAKMAIEEGLVKVDGEIEFRKRRKVRNGQRVEFQDRLILVKNDNSSS